ncbi:hypothetical protein LINPERHAP1_LOCUS126, partial [Linum perenne]
RKKAPLPFCFPNDRHFEKYLILKDLKPLMHGAIDEVSMRDELEHIRSVVEPIGLWGIFNLMDPCLEDALKEFLSTFEIDGTDVFFTLVGVEYG